MGGAGSAPPHKIPSLLSWPAIVLVAQQFLQHADAPGAYRARGPHMTDDDLLALTAYNIPEGDAHPAIIFERLIKLEQHQHFRDDDIAVEFLYRIAPKIKAGRQVLGMMALPTVQGQFKDLFEQLLAQWFGRMPHFLCVLDQEFWLAADQVTREALLEHEMCHVRQEITKTGELRFDQDGNPVYGIVGHDIEEFNYIVRKYGAWSDSITGFLEAAKK